MNHSRIIQFADNAIRFNIHSTEIVEAVDVHFAHCLGEEKNVIAEYQIEASEEAKFVIQKNGEPFIANITDEQVLFHLMQDGLTVLNGESKTNLIFHAAALAHYERGLFLCGKSGSGKSTLTAWLTKNGFQYLSDEVIAWPFSNDEVHGFCRSLVLKRGSENIWKQWQPTIDKKEFFKMKDGSVWITPTLLNASAIRTNAKPYLILFPTYSIDAEFHVEQLTSAKTLFSLLQCVVNSRNFEDQGIVRVKELSQKVLAYQMAYSNIEQASEWIQKIITQ
jgi:hypothetical protein